MEVTMNCRRVIRLFKFDNLTLISGVDIPFEEAHLIIHQPTLKEIAFIGENNFFIGCQLLNFSKKIISSASEDKVDLSNKSDFDIFMSIMIDSKSPEIKNQQICVRMVLALLFPQYQINFTPSGIVFINNEDKSQMGTITNMNFDEFKNILSNMFCLNIVSPEKEYNPAGKLAKKIADKLQERQRKLAELQGGKKEEKISILCRYVSVLTVGTKKDMNDFLNYTVYQLFDEFHRYELKEQYDVYFKARMAGAKDMKEPDDWMQDLHNPNTNHQEK